MAISTNGTAVSTSSASATALLVDAAYAWELRIRHTGTENYLISFYGSSGPWEYVDGGELVSVFDFRPHFRVVSFYIMRIGATDVTGVHAAVSI